MVGKQTKPGRSASKTTWERLTTFYLSLVFLSPKRWIQRNRIARSGEFDRAHYCARYRLNWLAKLLPLSHYLVRGESRGHLPNPDFDPHVYRYLYQSEGIADSALYHYVAQGKKKGYCCEPPEFDGVLPDIGQVTRSANRAIVIHLYYHDLWPEFKSALQRIHSDFDLFCTIVSNHSGSFSDLENEILTFRPDAHCFEFPNHGRDVFPFVHLINNGVLDAYDLVAKLHSKKSLHLSDGNLWRSHLITGIIPFDVDKVWSAFLEDSSSSCAVAPDQILIENPSDPNHANVARLLSRLGHELGDSIVSYPAGSMFLIKPDIIELLKQLGLTVNDFEVELSKLDGTTAHAMERAIGYLCTMAGKRIITTDQLSKK